MKTNRFINLITAAFGFAAFSTAGCAEKEKMAEAPLPRAKVVATTTVTTPGPGPTTAVPVAATATASPEVVSAQWIDIKDYTYDMRVQFFAGLKRLEARVDDQIRELTAKRAAMKSTTDTKGWDFAMKEMGDARSYLKSMGEELSKATPETWDQEKDKVGQAWVRTQEAYDKVKSSTTG
jgi:hypothetical protein